MNPSGLPLFHHPHTAPSAFQPEALVAAVREERSLPTTPVPSVCLLDFDGDLTDWLVQAGLAKPHAAWACFHTTMYAFLIDGVECGIIARTIGGPYAVLVAEQLHVSGARVILGLTSAGRVDPELPVPSIVVGTRAIRDEGTSFHYLPAAATVAAPIALADALYVELQSQGLPISRGLLWTTDAPYRETLAELAEHAQAGALAVEMQAASLFAFAEAQGATVGIVAHVTNAIDHAGEPFDKGCDEHGWGLAQAMCRVGVTFLSSTGADLAQKPTLKNNPDM